MRYIVLVCSLLALSSSFVRAGVQTPEAQLEVLHGRVVLRQEGQNERLVRTDERVNWSPKVDLEVGAGAEVRVSWSGQASCELWGPALLAWNVEPAQANAESGLRFSVEELGWADLEIRRGVHRLDLPGSWSAKLETGAYHLRSLPGGPIEVRHHAGSPAELTWSGDAEHVRPPLTIYPGSSLRLDRPPEGPADRTRKAEAWQDPSWPWRQRTDSPEQARERSELADRQERQTQGARPWPATNPPATNGPATSPRERVQEFQSPDHVRVEVSPVSGTELAKPIDLRAQRNAESSSRSGTSSALAQPDPWRGVRAADRISAGSIWVQRATGVEVRALDEGRWKVLVDSSAKESIWCFGRAKDWSLAPGCVAVFEADGSLRTSYGFLQESAAIEAR
jgi:hypothetical protein